MRVLGTFERCVEPRQSRFATLPGYRRATPDQRERLDALAEQLGSGSHILSLVTSAAWTDADARDEILDLAKNCPIDLMCRLARPTKQRRIPLLERAADGRRLVDHLLRLERRGRAVLMGREQVSPMDLANTLLRDLVEPSRLHQGATNSCGATVLQYQLATTQPAEYVRLSVDLFLAGRVRTRSGDLLVCDRRDIRPNDPCRTLSEQLLQNALMEFASPADYRLTASSDMQKGSIADRLPIGLRVATWFVPPLGVALELSPLRASGLTAWEYDHAAEALFDAEFSWRLSWHGIPHGASSQLDVLRGLAADGDFTDKHVALSVTYPGDHMLALKRIDWRQNPPRMTCFDPHGREQHMPLGAWQLETLSGIYYQVP